MPSTVQKISRYAIQVLNKRTGPAPRPSISALTSSLLSLRVDATVKPLFLTYCSTNDVK